MIGCPYHGTDGSSRTEPHCHACAQSGNCGCTDCQGDSDD